MKAKSDEFPMLIKSGSVTVKIYRGSNRGKPFYTLTWIEHDGRKRETFTDLAEARAAGVSKASSLARGDVDALKLTGSDRAMFVAARDALAGSGIAIDVATREFAEAVKILGDPKHLLDASRFYAKNVLAGLPDLSVAEAVSTYREARERENLSELYKKDIRAFLDRFSEAFQCKLRDVSPGDVREYLDGLKVGQTTRSNHLRVIRTFFDYAKSHGWLDQSRLTAAEAVKSGKSSLGERETFTPEEMAELLSHAPERFVPVLVLVAFVGVRLDEIVDDLPAPKKDSETIKGRVQREARGQLCWHHIDLVNRVVVVPPEISKTDRGRTIKLQKNAVEWLRPYSGLKGFVYNVDPRGDRQRTIKAVNEARAKRGVAPFEWRNNALRHSFATYRLEITKSPGAVALECGNSEAMIRRHYADRMKVTPAAAKAWFNITPAEEKKIIEMSA